MKIVTGVGENPHVTSDELRRIFEGILGHNACILESSENMEPELVSNNSLKIRSGIMCDDEGNISSVDIYDEIEIMNGTQGMKRIDLVVNRYTKNAETEVEKNEWVVIQGTPAASNPIAPAHVTGSLKAGDLIKDIPFIEVHLDGINVTEVKKLLTVREVIVEGIKLDGNRMVTHFGTCSTSASTAAKTVAIENFKLVTGARVIVKFTYANTVTSPTLNVSSTGAKTIQYRNSTIGSGVLVAGGTYEFVYDGTYWQLVGSARDKDIDDMKRQIAYMNADSKWIQKGSKQTGKTSVTMPDLTKTTDIMIVANINAANAADTDDNAVMLQVHFPVLSNGLPLVQNRLRAGYYQDGTYGGLVQFIINTTAGTISLDRATLNTEEENTTATTTWTVYYKYNNNL